MKKKDIQTLISVLENFREIDPGMNINMMLTFLEVARSGGVTGRSLEAALDLPQATAARMLRYFDRLQKEGKPGLDLFRVELDPLDYKAKLRYLNEDGEALLDSILKTMANR